MRHVTPSMNLWEGEQEEAVKKRAIPRQMNRKIAVPGEPTEHVFFRFILVLSPLRRVQA